MADVGSRSRERQRSRNGECFPISKASIARSGVSGSPIWKRSRINIQDVQRLPDLPISQSKKHHKSHKARSLWLVIAKTSHDIQVKCDETPGGCNNCSRLNLPCPNSPAYHHALQQQRDPEGNESLPTQAGLRRSRTYRSCRGCRTSKSRCSGERPTCLRCRQRGLECAYDGKQAPAWLEAASREAQRRSSMQGETWVFPCLSRKA